MITRLIRSPALHFFVIGAVLFGADRWWQARVGDQDLSAKQTIVITAGRIEEFRRDFELQFGRPPDAAQLKDLVRAAIDEEILYREAKVTGLDRNNPAVRHRLVQIARFVSDEPEQSDAALYEAALRLGLDRSDLVVRRQLATTMRVVAADTPLIGEAPPRDEELAAYLERHADRFREPWRIRLTHVFVGDDRHGAAAEADARALLETLRRDAVGPEDGPRLGDPYLPGHHLPWHTQRSLAKILGDDLAAAANAVGPAAWSGPFRSAYGWHLIWVHDVRPARLPDLAEVREQVLRGVLKERQAWRVEETLKAMRSRYVVRIEDRKPLGNTAARTDADG